MAKAEEAVSNPAEPDRPGADGARKMSPEPAPAPPAMSPKDTRDSAQYRASNQTQPGWGYHEFVRQFDTVNRRSSFIRRRTGDTCLSPLGW